MALIAENDAPIVAEARAIVDDLAVQPKISIVIPLFNEEDSIPHLVEALDAAIANYGEPA